MPKLSLQKNKINPHLVGKGLYTFPKVICPKMNVIPWLEFELADYDVTVQYISHYATGISSQHCFLKIHYTESSCSMNWKLQYQQCRLFFFFFFHHTTCESTCDTLASSAANQGDNTVSVAQGGYQSCVLYSKRDKGNAVYVFLKYQAIGQMSRVFANGPGDQGSIPGWVIPKTQKMALDAALFNTQHYKVRIKGKVEQSREWSSNLPYTSML